MHNESTIDYNISLNSYIHKEDVAKLQQLAAGQIEVIEMQIPLAPRQEGNDILRILRQEVSNITPELVVTRVGFEPTGMVDVPGSYQFQITRTSST